jgi:hypothetical protein
MGIRREVTKVYIVVERGTISLIAANDPMVESVVIDLDSCETPEEHDEKVKMVEDLEEQVSNLKLHYV